MARRHRKPALGARYGRLVADPRPASPRGKKPVFDPVTAAFSALEHFQTTRTTEAVVVNAGRCPDCLLSPASLVCPVTLKATLSFQDDDKGKTTSKTVRIDWECQLGHVGCHGETQPIVEPPSVKP